MKTREVIQILGTTYNKLTTALCGGKLPPPRKDCSGDFDWTQKDIEALRKALSVDRRFTKARGATARAS